MTKGACLTLICFHAYDCQNSFPCSRSIMFDKHKYFLPKSSYIHIDWSNHLRIEHWEILEMLALVFRFPFLSHYFAKGRQMNWDQRYRADRILLTFESNYVSSWSKLLSFPAKNTVFGVHCMGWSSFVVSLTVVWQRGYEGETEGHPNYTSSTPFCHFTDSFAKNNFQPESEQHSAHQPKIYCSPDTFCSSDCYSGTRSGPLQMHGGISWGG